MDFSWSDEQLEFKRSVAEFAQKELNQGLVERDKDGKFSRGNWQKCADFGLLGLSFPEKFGGSDLDILTTMLTMEGLGYGNRDNGLSFALNAQMWSVQHPILTVGSEEQKQKYLPRLISGEIIGAHGMTEPDSGSDAYSLRTRYEKVDGGYCLNGTKMFVTSAPICDIAVVFATKDSKLGMWGITAFIVERGTPGFSVSRDIEKMGLRTSPMGELVLEDCFIPEGNLLGREGGGAKIFAHSMEWERSCILGSHLGAMEFQLEKCIRYARDRQQGGQSIGKYQSISNRIADMKVRLETARNLLYKVAWLKSQKKSATMEAAMAKLYISESYVASSMDAIRILGGYGYMTEFEIERDLRDAMGGTIYSGTSDIQRNIISEIIGVVEMIYSLPQALDETAVKFLERDAIRCNGKGITYATLQQQANNLAHILQQQGVKRGDRVGIYINKDIESAVSIYGIMKAGAAYVPLDPFAPVERLSYVITDCQIDVVITKQNKLAQVRNMVADTALSCLIGVGSQDDLDVTCIPWDQVTDTELYNEPDIHVIEQDLAYILYTSGSTGTPKGIMHTHRSALSFAEWACVEYGLTYEDRVTNHAPYHFDLSTFDLFATMLAGGTVVIIPEYITKFPASHSQLLQDEKITVSYTVPFALIQLMERGALDSRDLSTLRWVLFAGEVFPTKHLRELMKLWSDKRFSNLYGPTETNVCTYYHVPVLADDFEDTIPIGLACANEEMLVVDADDHPMAQGEAGELLVRGGTVMRGYWGRPDLNEKGFYRRSAFGHYEDVFYRTGDLVQQLPDGNFKYFGRKDRQVKTRGYRVELDEVEVALLSHDDVKEAAVYTVSDGNGSNLIEAAVIPNEGTELTHSLLAKHVGGKLPPYGVPTKIHVMADFPRTSTGKINRRELQAMAEQILEEVVAN